MFRKLSILGVASVLLAACAPGTGAKMPELIQATPLSYVQATAPSADQARAIASFGERLFAEVRKDGEPNPVISPLSVFYALGMAGDGAAGETAAAFEKVFGLTAEQSRQVAAYLLAELAKPGPGTTLSAANSVWLDERSPVAQDWVDRVQAYYQAEAVRAELADPATVGRVNDWISGKTNGLIPEMLSEPLDPSTLALLVDALYLKAAWAREFSTDITREGEFRAASGAVPAYYLHARYDSARYLDTGSATGIVLPYQDGRLAFLAALPKSGELALDGDTIAGLLAAAQDRANVVLSMPKFDTQYGADLVPALAALGLGVACSPAAADFSGISAKLYISKVSHKVSMAVGEKGTETAAATVVEMRAGAALPPNDVYLTFDRPYVYAVVDLTTGVPLFLGAMDDPSKAPPAAR